MGGVVAALTDTQLQAIISQQISLARDHDRSERQDAREKAIDYFMGDMDKYVPPEANRSKVVSRDVADVIGWTLPQIMRVYASSDRMALVEPEGPNDVTFARQATDGLNYVFWKDNDGDEVLYDVTWDALMHANGVVKVFWDDTPVTKVSFHSGLTEDQIAILLQDEDIEPLSGPTETGETTIDPVSGTPVPTFDIRIKRTVAPGRFIIDSIPNEEFLIDADAVRTEDAAFTDHWQRKTRSALVEMGYSKDKVWSIPVAARVETPEQASRDPAANTSESSDKAMELVDYHECFIRIDADDDGEAEMLRVCLGGPAGDVLLDSEEWEDENPFEDIKCEPVPHRWLARSQADETIEIQDIKTVLTRQMLNNTYWVNNPQRFATGTIKNPEMLDTPVFGSTVFGGNGATVAPLAVPYIGDKALLGIQYVDEMRQQRTGVGRQSMALDPDVLQNQTAAAVHDQHDASYSQVEQYARNMAVGWRKVFRKLMRLMIKHQDYAREVMFNGKPVVIDPRAWNADMKVTINVGLGTGSRDRDLMMLGQVLNSQLMLADRFMQAGAVEDAIDMLPKIIQTMTRMAESAGIRNPEDYYPEYTQDKVAQLKQMAQAARSQPDPKMQIEQMKAQKDLAIQASEQQSNAARAQAEIAKAQSDAQVKIIEAQAKSREAELQAQLAASEIQVRQLEAAAKNETVITKAAMDNLVRLEVARIMASKDTDPKPNAAESKLETDAGVNSGGSLQ
jgi:hypothetical protein